MGKDNEGGGNTLYDTLIPYDPPLPNTLSKKGWVVNLSKTNAKKEGVYIRADITTGDCSIY